MVQIVQVVQIAQLAQSFQSVRSNQHNQSFQSVQIIQSDESNQREFIRGGSRTKIARRTTGAKGRKSNKAIIRFQKFDRSLNEIRNQC